jgi:hypothetical protein
VLESRPHEDRDGEKRQNTRNVEPVDDDVLKRRVRLDDAVADEQRRDPRTDRVGVRAENKQPLAELQKAAASAPDGRPSACDRQHQHTVEQAFHVREAPVLVEIAVHRRSRCGV